MASKNKTFNANNPANKNKVNHQKVSINQHIYEEVFTLNPLNMKITSINQSGIIITEGK